MNESELLDKILEIILNNKEKGFGLNSLRENGLNLDYDSIRDLLKVIENSRYNIAELSTRRDGEYIRANENTERFLKNGGFTAIEKREREEIEYNSLMKEKQLKKIEYELQLSKWQIKTKWWPLIISGASLIVSIIAIFLSINEPETKELKPKNKLIKDTTSVSNQVRKIDSLSSRNH